MKPIVLACRKRDLRKIKITCRCGQVFIAEVPEQIARALSLHPCPGCGAGFGVAQQADGKWKVERLSESIMDMAFTPAGPGVEAGYEKGFEVGLRIRIIDITKDKAGRELQYRNPHPEHIGKSGTIIGEQSVGHGHLTPRIRLDDGTMLTGAECWWEPVTQ